MCTQLCEPMKMGHANGNGNGNGQSPMHPKTEALLNKYVNVLNHAAIGMMTAIGHRSGLFDVMSTLAPSTSTDIALAARLSERYVREWLGAMVTGGIVEFIPEQGKYHLPAEHAAILTRAHVTNLAASCQWIGVLAQVEDRVLEAFQHGRGVPYSAYGRFHEVMAEESAQTVLGGLFDHILPMVDGLTRRLEAGMDVMDVGCGAGRALMEMGTKYPRSRFVGYDFSEEAVGIANAAARRRGLNNVRFVQQDAAKMNDREAFDLATAFDAIHDQVDPARVLANIHRSLKPGGTFLMQDILAETRVEQNMDNPLAPFVYTISCMHCMSVSLANNGAGLGAAWGKELAVKMLAEAGFGGTHVRTLPHDAMNYYYVSKKSAN